ncbi:MAG: YraN family protein [Flavobacteriaceae bacterium]|jgi:putative endonuclease|nr:YraN family protein [Flavobacteriaceae bacterium]
MAEHNTLGQFGEDLAADYLLRNGYKILERNWRFRKAEVDLIAQKENIVAIVEVKTRTSADFGNPQDFVKPKKIKLLVNAVNEYVVGNNLDVTVRFDIIAILQQGNKTSLEHLEDAFYIF